MFSSSTSFFLCLLFFSLTFSHVLCMRRVMTLWCGAVLGDKIFTGTYGVNYGRVADNLPPPESVVTLLKAAKIRNIRIYDADHQVLTAFKGSGIGIIICLPNELLKEISGSEDRATNWIKQNVEPFLPGTRIRGIAVGNEILGGTDLGLWEALLGAAKNLYSVLDRLGLAHQIQVSSPHSEAVFSNSYPPSACTFREDVLPFMKPLLQFFSQIGTPFYINAYPFLAYKNDPQHININYALFKKNPGIYDAKTKLHYDNMFLAQIDAAYIALEKIGFDKMEVIVSETGWASRGDDNEAGATVKNARTYNKNLRKLLLKKKGTPYRPKSVVRAYIFALFNENLKPGPTSERNFGLFKPDGSIAYDIGFTGLVPSSATSSFLSFKQLCISGYRIFLYNGFYNLCGFPSSSSCVIIGDKIEFTSEFNDSLDSRHKERMWLEMPLVGEFHKMPPHIKIGLLAGLSELEIFYHLISREGNIISANPIGAVSTTNPTNITLNRGGEHYFICGVGRHCSNGQRLAIAVSASSTAIPPAATTAPPSSSAPTSFPAFIPLLFFSLFIIISF
ncbi:Glucan endo-1,3-beta-glucosidase 14, partial [Mucuna pruriens]